MPKIPHITFKTHETQLHMFLGRLELEIIFAIWDLPEDRGGIKEIHDMMQANGYDGAYNSCHTTIYRMMHKGLLYREKRGKRTVYRVMCDTEQEFTQTMVQGVVNALMRNFRTEFDTIIGLYNNAKSITR